MLDTARSSTFDKLFKSNALGLSRFEDAIYIRECIAPSSWTLPSHASLFTGMYPSEHGSHETRRVKSLDIGKIKLRHKTIVGDLKKMGYKTYGISANPYIHPIYGFDEFDYFREESYFTDMHGSVLEIAGSLKPRVAKYRNMAVDDTDTNMGKILKLARVIGKEDPGLLLNMIASGVVLTPIAALKKINAKYIDGWPVEKGGKSIVRNIRSLKLREPFFLFVNLMEAHDPYIGKKGLDFNWSTPFMKKKVSAQLIERWKRIYNVGMRKAADYSYQIIKEVLGNSRDETIVVVTSDHGQAFGEHGFIGHGTVLYDEVVKVPMLLLLPKVMSKKLGKGEVSLVNVRKFILSAIAGEPDPLKALYSQKVYAESFGIPSNVRQAKGIDMRRLEGYEKYTKRTFGK